MPSVDDLLNSSDSDDELPVTGSGAVDLESLLLDKEDSDDEVEVKRPPIKPSIIPSAVPSLSNKPLSAPIKEDKKEDPVKVEPKKPAESLDLKFLAKTAESNLLYKTNLFEQVAVEKEDTANFNSLEVADNREQRFLKSGSRDIVSALQAKRINSALSVYSNIKLDDMSTISNQLKRNGSYKQHGPGAASCVLVTLKFIAVGTTRGLIIMFDNNQEIRQVLGSSIVVPARSPAPVMSIDVNQPGSNLLIAGYATGELALWDIVKGTIIMRISDLHLNKIVKVTFIRNIADGLDNVAATPSDLVVISADCKGTMHRTKFTKGMWTAYTTESKCLLDGTSGSLLDLSILLPYVEVHQQQLLQSNSSSSAPPVVTTTSAKASSYSGIIKREPTTQLLAFNFATQTCLVRVAPTISIIYKWPAPGVPRGGAVVSSPDTIACLDMSWSDRSHFGEGLITPIPIVARCWNSVIEVLCITDKDPNVATAYRHSVAAREGSGTPVTKEEQYAFNVVAHKVIEGNDKFLSVKWLNSTRLIVLTSTHFLVLSSTLDVIEHSAHSAVMSTNIQSLQSTRLNAEDAIFLNLVGVSGKFLHILSVDYLFKLQLQSCFDMANQLIYNGQWLEALALILENVAKSPSLLITNESDVDKLIVRYVELAVQQPAHSSGSSGAALSAQSRNHYHLVAGVCIEYCVSTQRMDLLYGELFDIFTAAHQQVVFLESLEPHILSRSITILPPNIIQEFFKSSVQYNRLPSIERCVTYFDIHSVDLNFITRFLYEHQMYSSFLYAFAFGLGDFTGAFQTIFTFMLPGASAALNVTSPKSRGAAVVEDDDNIAGLRKYPNPEQLDIGYKLLLFLLYTFESRVFPRGDTFQCSKGTTIGLLSLVTQSTLIETAQTFAKPNKDTSNNHGAINSQHTFNGEFPYLTCLSFVDPEAVLHVLSKGLLMAQSITNYDITPDAGAVSHDVQSELSYIYRNLFTFCSKIAEKDSFLSTHRMQSLFLEKFLNLLSSCPAQLDDELLDVIVKYCNNKPNRKAVELSMTALAEHQSKFPSVAVKLKQHLQDANFWIAALSIKKSIPVTSSGVHHHSNTSGSAAAHTPQGSESLFAKALRHYITIAKNSNDNYKPLPTVSTGANPSGAAVEPRENALLVFDYIESQLHFIAQVFTSSEQRTAFCHEIVKVVAELYAIESLRTTRIVCSQLIGMVTDIIMSTKQETKIQFELLHSIVVHFERDDAVSEIMTIKDCFNSKNVLVYFKLLCYYDATKAFSFLKKYQDLYSVEECLTICREQGISDAMSYLLERNNDVSGALSVLQKDFSNRVRVAKQDIDKQLKADLANQTNNRGSVVVLRKDGDRSLVSQILSKQGAARVEATMKLPVYKTLSTIVNCAADLCANYATTADPSMWLSIFDHLLLERQTIRSGVVSSSGEIVVILIGLMLQALMNKMKGVVTPQEIIRRVTSQSSASGVRLGEFKDVMINMLETNTYELYLNETVNQFIHKDMAKLHTEKLTIMRKACYRSNVEGSDPSESPLDPFSDPNTPVIRSSTAAEKRKSKRGNKKVFRRFAEFSKNVSFEVFTAVPNVVNFSDFESRVPGSLPVRAVYTASLNM